MTAIDAKTQQGRRLPVWGFVVLVAVYLAIIQLVPHLFGEDSYAKFQSTDQVFRGLLSTTVTGSVIALGAIAVLRWWRPAFVEEPSLRLPRWVWVFPGIMLVAIIAGTSYSKLADKGLGFTLALLGSALLIGVSEEAMFRGVGVVTFRQAGFSEGKVALWTCVIFGVAHSTNLFTEGPSAFGQVFATVAAGYFFYLTLRVSGSLVVCMVLHGLWDFALFTNGVSDPQGRGGLVMILADVVLLILAAVTLRKVFPKRGAPEQSAERQQA